MTTLLSAISTNVQGRAVYIEATHPSGAVTQVLIMPEGLTSAHAIAPLAMYRRRLTPMTPRKTWRHIASSITTEGAKAAHSGNPEIASSILTFLTPMFDGFVAGVSARNQCSSKSLPRILKILAKGRLHIKSSAECGKHASFSGFLKNS